RERGKKRLRELSWDDRLARVARNYSKKMAREGFFGHYDPRGKTVIDRADDSGVGGWAKIGENLFMCRGIESFSDLAVRGWMRSPDHRKNILDRKWTSTGIGVAKARDGSIYITQVFLTD
ncbi:MAG: CAP domain-containing protein, partial [Saprospiraceae bacterium]|nr:CAP domain-containing protein [Pyrinomonadaceae bacterium]